MTGSARPSAPMPGQNSQAVHYTPTDVYKRQALRKSAAQIAGLTGSRLKDAETSLEDVFIQLMGAAQDNIQ